MKALSTRLFALNEAWKENANIYRQMAKRMNLTDMAMWALYTLRVEPGEMTQSRMCEFLHEPKQTINSALKKMEADGLITLLGFGNAVCGFTRQRFARGRQVNRFRATI